MDVNQIADIIDDYADEKKYREFGELLCNNYNDNQIITFIQNKIHTSDFVKIWKHLILGLSYFRIRSLNIIKATLIHVDEEETTPISRVNELLNYIINVLPKYETKHLVELVKFCLKGVQNMNTNRLSWKDIFPEIVSQLAQRDEIDFEGKCLSGKEFEKEIINVLCSLQWEPSRLAVIISIFSDLHLNKEDHLRVLTKLASYIESLTPQEVPSFVYQLLILCKNQNFLSIVVMLQQYFGLRLYKQNEIFVDSMIAPEDSESRGLDILEEAELSVFFHIRKLASINSYAIRDYLNFIRPLNKAPEFLLHPFHLKVLLVIFEVEEHRDKVWEILKSLVIRYHIEKSRRDTSIWFNHMSSKLTDLESIINVLLYGKTSEDITEALVDFGLKLLNVKSALPHVVDSNVLKLWELGKTIIIKILTKATKHARSILNQILQSMRISHNKIAHIECLIACEEVVMLALMMQEKFIHEIMNDLQQMPGSSALLFLDIVIPLTKLRTNIKEQTILLFRKSLYSSKTETRQMAVVGYSRLLTKIEIKDVESLSQMSNSLSSSSSSGPSLFTQLSLHRSQFSQGIFSEEALSWEILSILKRCFMQKLEVRNQLYEGLVHTAFKNKKLSVPILEILWTQISKYYVIEEETLPPLDFSRLSITKDTDVNQQESFGKLLFVIGMVLVQIQDEDFPSTIGKFQKLIDSICDRMISCELIHFELDDGTDLSDVLPECKQKVIVLQEALRVYEALIAYKIKSWNSDSLDNGPKIVSLFQSYSRLVHFAKNIGKSKKGSKKKKNDSNVSQKCSSATFKVPNTIMDVSISHKALQLLHEPTVEWTTIVEANVVRVNKEIHRYFFQSTRHIFSDAANKKSRSRFAGKKIEPTEAFKIACIIFNRCIKTLDTYKDFDCISAVEALECFHVIIGLITPFEQDKETFDPFKDEKSPLYIWKVIKTYQKLFEEHEDDDSEMKKLPTLLLNTLIYLFTLIPSKICGSVKEFYDWMVQYAKDQILINKPCATLFFTLLFNMHLKYKLDPSLFKIVISSIGNVLGTTREVVEDEECFKVVNELSLNSAFTCISNAMKSLLDDAEIILTKLKCEHTFRTHVPTFNGPKSGTLTATAIRCNRQSLSEKEASVSELLYVIAKLLDDLTVVVIPPGVLSELLLRNIIQIFSILVNFTKYFSSLSSAAVAAMRGARFEELVKFVGRSLSPGINFFILHLEEEDKKIQSAQKKKKSTGSNSRKQEIQKNTRCIPKLVYMMEQFGKCVMQLSNKTKIDLHKFIGTGTTRDFRILVNELEIPEQDDDDSQQGDENEESVTNEEKDGDENPEGNIMEAESQEDIVEDSEDEEKQESDKDLSDNSIDQDLEENETPMPPLKKLKC